MSSVLEPAVESVIESMTGTRSPIVDLRSTGGGCINHTQVISLVDGRTFFLKSNKNVASNFFQCEADGLTAMRQTNTIRVPRVIGTGNSEEVSFLILEYIAAGNSPGDFMRRLGSQLAQMHVESTKAATGRFGFEADNFIGSTPQPNQFSNDWPMFWQRNRFENQLTLARQQSVGNADFFRLSEKLMDRLESLLGTGNHTPVLIHGDLWSGNYLCDDSGNPVLIDPAVYFADAEAEFGMTTLFGGVNSDFYDAYHEVLPRLDGADVRISIYRLYHLMNHLNLFGSSYLGGCLEILKRIA